VFSDAISSAVSTTVGVQSGDSQKGDRQRDAASKKGSLKALDD